MTEQTDLVEVAASLIRFGEACRLCEALEPGVKPKMGCQECGDEEARSLLAKLAEHGVVRVAEPELELMWGVNNYRHILPLLPEGK